jgi:NDP-sugar pyrophosphorylase family protein
MAPSGDSPAKPLEAPATSLASISPKPAALLEILGEPILHRMVEVLRRGQVELIYLVVDEIFRDCEVVRKLSRERIQILSAPAKALPALIESAVKRCSEHGVENVVLMEASAYIELDFKDFLQAHQSGNQRLTLAYDESGPLPVALVSSSEPELAASVFQRNLRFPQATTQYLHRGYANRLKNAQDLRLLAQDG